MNYGGIGAVIGHEMSHGFDDQGRQFDAQGQPARLVDRSRRRPNYKERATLVDEQFNGYIGVDTLHVNGKLTLGENIADLGGLAIAYAAYMNSLHGKSRRRSTASPPAALLPLLGAGVAPAAAPRSAAHASCSPTRIRRRCGA